MNTKWIIGIGAVIVIAAGWYFLGSQDDENTTITVPVKKGKFEVSVVVTGELLAKNSEDIVGPSGLRRAGLWQVKIQDLVPEGTIVKAGDYIATLDRSEVTSKLRDIETEVQKYESQFTQTKLDTTLDLRGTREELINLKYAMEERQIEVDQDEFEPPAVQRQNEIAHEKAQRAYQQALENYSVKTQQAKAKMQEIAATLNGQLAKKEQMEELLGEFVIKAPMNGMVEYVREWNGKKKGVGSNIGPWDPAVATLPDLSVMTSQTYVNEIDIGKVKEGQEVLIGVDALPDKRFKGIVTNVANIGEQKPNSTAKVFEVEIEVSGSDTILRPSMTTSNTIVVARLDTALRIPLEGVHGNDSIAFVFVESGFTIKKQEVVVGLTNDNEAAIEAGLKESEKVLLSMPENPDEMPLVSLDSAVKQKAEERLLAQLKRFGLGNLGPSEEEIVPLPGVQVIDLTNVDLSGIDFKNTSKEALIKLANESKKDSTNKPNSEKTDTNKEDAEPSKKKQKEKAPASSSRIDVNLNNIQGAQVVTSIPNANTGNGLVYKVQVFAVDKALPETDPKLKKIKEVSSEASDGIHRYFSGAFKTKKEADTRRQELEDDGFKGIFVVAFKDGKRLQASKKETM